LKSSFGVCDTPAVLVDELEIVIVIRNRQLRLPGLLAGNVQPLGYDLELVEGPGIRVDKGPRDVWLPKRPSAFDTPVHITLQLVDARVHVPIQVVMPARRREVEVLEPLRKRPGFEAVESQAFRIETVRLQLFVPDPGDALQGAVEVLAHGGANGIQLQTQLVAPALLREHERSGGEGASVLHETAAANHARKSTPGTARRHLDP
jgi:hypothetical protein